MRQPAESRQPAPHAHDSDEHRIAVVAMHGLLPFDLATPCEVFGRAPAADGRPAYRVEVCGEAEDIAAGYIAIRAPWTLDHAVTADTVIVPGLANPLQPVAPVVLDTIRAAYDRGARIASICTGAFVLAAAGLLDGLTATTHWLAAGELAARHPHVRVDPTALFVDNGRILTSAGAAAGLDLCLHLVRCDLGAAVAADAARLAVMPLMREGGQSQFVVPAPPEAGHALEPLLGWIEANLARPLTLADMAAQAAMSTRTLSRRFRQQTGTTPLQWLLAARVRKAQLLLERSALSVEQIAGAVGFESAGTLRGHFAKLVGVPPRAYRRNFTAAG